MGIVANNSFLPTTWKDVTNKGWDQLDIILVSGDAYIDHPSFAVAIIGRVLESYGYKVGVIAQPDVTNLKDISRLKEPRLFWGITSGNMDSMVNHYTAQKKLRSEDAYTPDGKIGVRPDRALLRYTNLIKQVCKDKPVIIGGIEASMRRISHYDYWSDKVRNSILVDSKADILVYGMGEKIILNIADKLNTGYPVEAIQNIAGTVVLVPEIDNSLPSVCLPEGEKCNDPEQFLLLTQIFQKNYDNKIIYQQYGNRFIKHNPPAQSFSAEELDSIYDLPFVREPHPAYRGKSLKAWEQIRDSITAHRGCGGGCNFCAIGYHQGKKVSSRSRESILDEVNNLVKKDYFRGTISDVGGPSANMYEMKCTLPDNIICKRSSCLYPQICEKLDYNHDYYLNLLAAIEKIDGVKNLFIASGIRFDLALKSPRFIKAIAKKYIGGHLKLAPEHSVQKVLNLMNKPSIELYENFSKFFFESSQKADKKQMIIPYIIVGHPGTDTNDAINLALYLKRNNLRLEQVQEFYPTPMTPSTAMYYTKNNITDGKPLFVPTGREIRLQKALVQWFMPGNKKYVIEALRSVGRLNLLDEFYPARAESGKQEKKEVLPGGFVDSALPRKRTQRTQQPRKKRR